MTNLPDRWGGAAACLVLMAAPAMAAAPMARPAGPPTMVRIASGFAPGDATALRFAAHVAALRAASAQSRPVQAARPGGTVLALTGGKVLRPSLTVGRPKSYIALQFGFTAGNIGFNSASFTFTAPVGGRTVTVVFTQSLYSVADTEAFSFDAAFPFFTAPGTWTLTGATLADNAGNTATYDAGQLARLFTPDSFTVVNNGVVAAYPPVIGKGVLASTTISLSSKFPQLKAAVHVNDTPTGVTQALLFLQPPGQTYEQAQLVTIGLPVKAGVVSMYDTFYPSSPTVAWTIKEYLVCDFAGNCSGSSDPATIISLFGTNIINVTN